MTRTRVMGVALAVLAALALGARFAAEAFTMDSLGGSVVIAHGFTITVVLGFLWIAAGVGRALIAPIDLGTCTTLRFPYSLAVGLGATSIGVTALGAVGWLTPVGIGTLIGLLALASISRWSELANDVEATVRAAIPAKPDTTFASWLLLLTIVTVGSVGLMLALAPPFDWDALMYHLQIPTQFLSEGAIFLPEDNLHAALIGLVHMLYVPLLAADIQSGPAVFNMVIALVLSCSVGAVIRELTTSSQAAWIGQIVLWGTPTILLVAATARIDVTVAWLLFLAHSVLLTTSLDKKHLILAGLLLGFAVGTKYHAGLYALALCPGILLARADRSFGGRVTGLCTVGIVAVMAASPWLIKNAVLFGAPFFPFGAPDTLEPWLADVAATSSATFDLSSLFTLSQARNPFTFIDAFINPGVLTVETEGAYYYLSPALALIPLLVIGWKRQSIMLAAGPAVLYLALLLLPLPSTNLRYLIPALPALTVALTLGYHELQQHFNAAAWMRGVTAALLLGTLIPLGLTTHRWITGTSITSHILGWTSADHFLRSHFDRTVTNMVQVVQLTNDATEDSSRILLLFDARGYYFKAETIQDVRVINWPVLSRLDAVDQCLPESGITHVLLASGALAYYQQRGVPGEALGIDALGQFIDRCLDTEFFILGFTLYNLNARPVESSGSRPD